MRYIELLAPAKNVECARQAILHGADAVYIGANRYGARSTAGNNLEDIKEVVDFAHIWKVRVYITLNVILHDNELEEVEKLIWDLWEIGVDALIIQDMGITKMNLPPIPLHASTQTDNRTVKKVKFLEEAGFKQVVLARELSLSQIREISSETNVNLEFFIHGALCVSYSGQCYMSHVMCGRSANRGECAQYCRLPYDLVDADGKIIIRHKHILSLKDLNLTNNLELLIDAGISSLKIEGRLKDAYYVKNVTAWYRQQIDKILERRLDLKRTSTGISRFTFEPDPVKSFNRGFTDYFTLNRKENMSNPDTPKSLGEKVGVVKQVFIDKLLISGNIEISNGDGLSYFNANREFEGFRVNRVENNLVFPARMPKLKTGTELFRTYDQSFIRKLDKPSAVRYIAVSIKCWEIPFGFALSMDDNYGHRVAVTCFYENVLAQKPQKEQVCRELTKLGNTRYEASSCEIEWSDDWFMPISNWSEMRRKLCEKMDLVFKIEFRREEIKFEQTFHQFPDMKLSYLGNVLNKKAEDFYISHGVTSVEPALESKKVESPVLMFNKFCLRFELGSCPKQTIKINNLNNPVYLVNKNKHIRLDFDCKVCEMRLTEDLSHG
jgi:23S rRNA 5-hydroxycytidine C2501 synthase